MNRNITKVTFLKSFNQLAILGYLRRELMSRAELARKIGLSRAAVSLLVENLIKQGFLIETGTVLSDTGRRPTLLTLRSEYCYCIGVSIARDKTGIGIVDFQGNIVCTKEIQCFGTVCDTLDGLANEIEMLLIEYEISSEKLLGIGVNTPGLVDIVAGKVLEPPNFEKWHNVYIVKELEKRTGYRSFIENYSNSIALAEKHYGCGEKFDSMMVMTVDSGIGVGIIIQNSLYRGANGFGSEIGHTCIDIHGDNCACGNRGCLELYAARPAILNAARKISLELDSWSKIVDHAIEGDKDCMDIILRQAEYLAVGIVNTMNVLELDAVVLTGDMVYKPDILLSNLRQRVNEWVMSRNFRKFPMITSTLPGHAEILCAASVVLEKFFCGEIDLVNNV